MSELETVRAVLLWTPLGVVVVLGAALCAIEAIVSVRRRTP